MLVDLIEEKLELNEILNKISVFKFYNLWNLKVLFFLNIEIFKFFILDIRLYLLEIINGNKIY